MAKFFRVTTVCPYCGSAVTLTVEQLYLTTTVILDRLNGSRVVCSNRDCKKMFVFRREDAKVGEVHGRTRKKES